MHEKEQEIYADFGQQVYGWMKHQGEDFFHFEESEDLADMAFRSGLVDRQTYNPEKHGELDAEPGDLIWVFL